MMNNKLNIICDNLINIISSKANVFNIEKGLIDENHINLNMINNFLSVSITFDGIVVFYANEHDEFWSETYNSESIWIKDAGDFIALLLSNTVIIEYYYDQKTGSGYIRRRGIGQ